jgi:putative transposase
MSDYRRNFVPGGTYFFTVNLEDRGLRLLTDNIDLLRGAFRYAHARRPFTIDAVVVLPEHLHAIWTLPEGDADFSTRWMLIKSSFSRSLENTETPSASRRRRRERRVWQRRFWERTIRDEADFVGHVDYIHHNPVKHGHAADQAAWPYSSYRRWAALNSP